MFAKLARSWDITVQSWNVLRADKHLMLFPILSSIACLLVLATFAVPFAATVPWSELESSAAGSDDPRLSPIQWAMVFLYYVVNFFVIVFFNSALVACAMNRFNGEDSSAGAGLRVAARRLPQILAWAVLAATVGVILQMVAERLGVIGRIVLRLIGMAWAIATFFVVPVLVVEGVGPIEAVKRSVSVLRKNWGESLVTNVGLSAVTGIAVLLALIPAGLGIGLTVTMDSAVPVIVGIAISIVLWVGIALISSTLKGIIRAALYRYAVSGEVPEGFDPAVLQGAFREKSRTGRSA